MAGTFATELAERGVVRVGGPDSAHFLNNLVTAEVAHLAPGEAAYAALLTPQGKMLFDFLVAREGEGYLLDTAAANAAALAQRLGFYKLRAKVTVADASSDEAVIAFWGGEPPATLPGVAFTDPRLAALGTRAIVPRGSLAGVLSLPGLTRTDAGAFHAHRVALGVPEGGRDFAFGEAALRDVPVVVLYAWWMLPVSRLQPAGSRPLDLSTDPDLAEAEEEARRLLAEATAGARVEYPDVDVTLLPAHALNPVAALLEASAGAGLLVVSRHGGNALTRLIFSSIGDIAVRQAPCPVAVVPETSTHD